MTEAPLVKYGNVKSQYAKDHAEHLFSSEVRRRTEEGDISSASGAPSEEPWW